MPHLRNALSLPPSRRPWCQGLTAVLLSAVLVLPAAHAATPVIAGYGNTQTAPRAAERPDPALRYRVVFNITQGSAKDGKPNPSLAKVARFINLLGDDGVRPQRGDVVAIVHGDARPT